MDIYCERTSALFWAEPVNALSNLSFVLAALVAAATARRLCIRKPVAWGLIGLAAVIGLGSFLSHTFANQWSALADVLPIWTFVALFVLTIRLAMGEGGDAAPSAPDPLNGSGQYVPALLALIVFSVLSWSKRHQGAQSIIAATGVFLLSLAFRTLDRDIFPALPLGKHFLWHLLIGLLLQMLLRTGRFAWWETGRPLPNRRC